MNDDLPEGWVMLPLSELLSDFRTGPFGSALHESDYVEGGIPVINPTNLVNGIVRPNRLKTVNRVTFARLREYSLLEGDIIIARRGEMGRSALITASESGWLCGTGSAILRLRQGLSPEFVQMLVSSPEVRAYLSDASVGSTMDNLNQRTFKAMPILVPPLAEQERIVARIKELSTKSDICQGRLVNVRLILKRFRQAVLAAACSGRLTADWRARHPTLQPLNDVIKAIQQRRLKAGSTEAHREKIAEVYSHPEEGEQETLPSGWEFVRLAKLADSFDYGTSAKSNSTGAVPVLRMGNLQNGEIDWTNLAFTSDEREINDYALQPNTVLFNRTNSPELVGKTAIYRGERRAIFAGYLIRVRVVPELDPEYLNLCLNTTYAREFCSQVKTDGVSQSNINAQKLGAFEVPYCPIQEQREIVRRVQALDAVSDKIEARYAKARAYVDKITQSILAKAFRGELVPTEAALAKTEGRTYETAEQLVARIGSGHVGTAKARRVSMSTTRRRA